MKRILITGGSSGIGLATVKRLVADGHSVRALALNPAEDWPNIAGDHLAQTVGYHSVDLTDFPAAVAAVLDGVSKLGGIDVLVNNAGVMTFENGDGSTIESVRRQLSLNLEAPIHISAAVLKEMLEQKTGGLLINISSVAGLKATPKLAVYGATKAGLIHYSRALAAEYASKKIRVNIICPGAVETTLTNSLMFSLIKRGIPLGDFQKAEEVAGLISWLISDSAINITGSVFSLDGGMSL